MLENKVYILSTRTVGAALVSEAAQNDIIIDEVPFIDTAQIKNATIEQKIDELAHQRVAVVFTSMTAVAAVAKILTAKKTSWKIFCTDGTTQKMVKEIFGEENICATADNAKRLAEKITEDSSIKSIVFFCGDQRRNELPGKLKHKGIAIDEVIVYKTILTPQVVLKQYDGILFFSPSAVQSFFSKNSITDKTRVFAIGATTANAAKSFTKQPIIISNKPAKEHLVAVAIKHFSKSKIH